MVERIGELWRDKKIEGIAALRDESDRDGYRVVIEIKRDAMPDVVLNQLYRYTPLQSSFGANIVALDGGRPQVMNLKDLLTSFVAFREEVISRRTKFLLNKARDRAHILVGLAIAVANIDEVIRLIRASKDANEAREALMARDWQAQDRRGDGHADRRSAPPRLAGRHLRGSPPSRPRRSSTCACSASPRSAATRSRPSSTSSPPRSPTISTSCARAPASSRSSRTSSPR